MSTNKENKENETQIPLNLLNNDFNSVNINNKKCCYQPDDDKLWCNACVPSCLIEGWTSGNPKIDDFIKDTIYNAKYYYDNDSCYVYPLLLQWVPFDRFEDIKQIGIGGFAKVYSAKWIDGNTKYIRQADRTWKILDPEPMIVALKRLNGSQDMSAKYLNEVYFFV